MSSKELHGLEKLVPDGISPKDYVESLLVEIKDLKCERDKYRKECQVLKEIIYLKDQASKERLEQIKRSVNAQILEIEASETLSNGLLDAGTGGYCALGSAQPQGECDEELYSDIYPTVAEEATGDTNYSDTASSRSSSSTGSVEEKTELDVYSETASYKIPPPLPTRQSGQMTVDNAKRVLSRGSLTFPRSKSAIAQPPNPSAKFKKWNSFKAFKSFLLKKDRRRDGGCDDS